MAQYTQQVITSSQSQLSLSRYITKIVTTSARVTRILYTLLIPQFFMATRPGVSVTKTTIKNVTASVTEIMIYNRALGKIVAIIEASVLSYVRSLIHTFTITEASIFTSVRNVRRFIAMGSASSLGVTSTKSLIRSIVTASTTSLSKVTTVLKNTIITSPTSLASAKSILAYRTISEASVVYVIKNTMKFMLMTVIDVMVLKRNIVRNIMMTSISAASLIKNSYKSLSLQSFNVVNENRSMVKAVYIIGNDMVILSRAIVHGVYTTCNEVMSFLRQITVTRQSVQSSIVSYQRAFVRNIMSFVAFSFSSLNYISTSRSVSQISSVNTIKSIIKFSFMSVIFTVNRVVLIYRTVFIASISTLNLGNRSTAITRSVMETSFITGMKSIIKNYHIGSTTVLSIPVKLINATRNMTQSSVVAWSRSFIKIVTNGSGMSLSMNRIAFITKNTVSMSSIYIMRAMYHGISIATSSITTAIKGIYHTLSSFSSSSTARNITATKILALVQSSYSSTAKYVGHAILTASFLSSVSVKMIHAIQQIVSPSTVTLPRFIDVARTVSVPSSIGSSKSIVTGSAMMSRSISNAWKTTVKTLSESSVDIVSGLSRGMMKNVVGSLSSIVSRNTNLTKYINIGEIVRFIPNKTMYLSVGMSSYLSSIFVNNITTTINTTTFSVLMMIKAIIKTFNVNFADIIVITTQKAIDIGLDFVHFIVACIDVMVVTWDIDTTEAVSDVSVMSGTSDTDVMRSTSFVDVMSATMDVS